jgi:hypothetical protein
MHAHRSAGPPPGVAPPGSLEFEHQRRILLELAVDPPAAGSPVAALAAELELTAAEVEAAATGLERAGVAERRRGRLRATRPVRAVEALWPLGL